jgi:hypothetical protein
MQEVEREEEENQQQQQSSTLSQRAPPLLNYYDSASGEAKRTFAPKEKYDADCDVKQAILERIDLLESVNCDPKC